VPRGRKPKLTPELQQKLVSAIAAGNYIETACALVGIGTTTFYRWLELGSGPNARSPYREFREAVKKAEAAAEAKRIQIITEAAKEDWKAAAWYLERRYPERWGRRDRLQAELEHSGTVTANVEQHAHIVQRIVADPEARELARELFRRAIAGDLGGRRAE
jgi:hypothetical protein